MPVLIVTTQSECAADEWESFTDQTRSEISAALKTDPDTVRIYRNAYPQRSEEVLLVHFDRGGETNRIVRQLAESIAMNTIGVERIRTYYPVRP